MDARQENALVELAAAVVGEDDRVDVVLLERLLRVLDHEWLGVQLDSNARAVPHLDALYTLDYDRKLGNAAQPGNVVPCKCAFPLADTSILAGDAHIQSMSGSW